jgi:DUF2075 family protein
MQLMINKMLAEKFINCDYYIILQAGIDTLDFYFKYDYLLYDVLKCS